MAPSSIRPIPLPLVHCLGQLDCTSPVLPYLPGKKTLSKSSQSGSLMPTIVDEISPQRKHSSVSGTCQLQKAKHIEPPHERTFQEALPAITISITV